MKAPVTRSEEGCVYGWVKAHDWVKEGGAFITVLHGVGEGRRGANGAAAREEAAALSVHYGRKEKGKTRPGGLARPTWPLGAGWAGSATVPIGPKVEEDFFSDKKWIFEFTKALEICRRRFRRNFEMGIFPKFF
jgi:hypothetical protein